MRETLLFFPGSKRSGLFSLLSCECRQARLIPFVDSPCVMEPKVRVEAGLNPGEVLERVKRGTAFEIPLIERENEARRALASCILLLDAIKTTNQLSKREWAARGPLRE